MALPASFSLTTDFDAPPALSNLAVEPDDDGVTLVATVDASADTFHYEYVWEAQSGDDPWAEVGRTTDPAFRYYLAPFNLDISLRVKDSNGSQYSEPVETVTSLPFERWAMTHTEGNVDFIQELRYVQSQSSDMPLDTTMLQPLSGPDGATQFPIMFVGQHQGERAHFSVQVLPEDSFLIGLFRAAALEPQGTIALKDPKGPVYLVQLAGFTKSELEAGHRMVEFDGIQVA